MHKRSATELQQPVGKQTLQFCIYTVNENSLFSKILIIHLLLFTPLIYHFTISFSQPSFTH